MKASKTQVLVAGGGPAGSVAAAILAREGIEVTLVERLKHPRYHIGESLLTSVMPIFEFIDVRDEVERHGFKKKYGGYFRVKQGERPGHITFAKLSRYDYSFQVLRSEFDELLFGHARKSGATTMEETAVTSVDFENERPVAAELSMADGSTAKIEFDYMVDATGLSGLLSTHYFNNRREEPAFANVAVGGYFRGALPYRNPDGEEEAGAFSMEALTDGSGWTWAIPLHTGVLSVGVVLHRDVYRERFKKLGSNEAIFEETLKNSPDVTALIEPATRVDDIHVWRDYSYFAREYAGPRYRLAGDAAGFIDPLFSTGVHMAFLGALSAAATICSEIRGEGEPAVLERFHHRCLSMAYTRLAVTVAGFYRQLHNQQEIVLPGITSENFQSAFDFIQPVVSGNVDLNSGDITEDALERAMDYASDMMLEIHQLETNNKVAKMMASAAMDDLTGMRALDAIDGLYIRMKRGQLGIARAGAVQSADAGVRRRVIKGIVATAQPRN